MPESTPTLAAQIDHLYDLVAGFHATHLLAIGREVGLWELLAAEPGSTATGLAARLGTDPWYTDVLCRTAFAFAILDRDGSGWRLAPHFDVILGRPDAPFFLGDAARTHVLIGEDYAAYPDRLRHGHRVSYQEHGDAFMAQISDGLRTLPRIFLDVVLPRLPHLAARLEAGATVLDVGCGAGWALVTFAERFPSSRLVGIDVEPHSVTLARELIAARGLSDRCEARLLAAEALPEEAAYDVATSFLVVHEIGPELKDGALASVARALRPGGFLVVFDEAYPETDEAVRSMPARFAAVAQWFELTWGNRIDGASELRERLLRAGLRPVAETTFSRFTIIVAERPR